MSTPSAWLQLVRDATHRRMSQWRLREIAETVREADGAWTTQVSLMDAELVKALDTAIFLERDRDQCARERDALAARLAALTEAAREYMAAEEEWEAWEDDPFASSDAAISERRATAAGALRAALGEGPADA